MVTSDYGRIVIVITHQLLVSNKFAFPVLQYVVCYLLKAFAGKL